MPDPQIGLAAYLALQRHHAWQHLGGDLLDRGDREIEPRPRRRTSN
jgi:hypothetical protein